MMADVHDKATRSKNMRAIATRDTAIEKRIAAATDRGGIHLCCPGSRAAGTSRFHFTRLPLRYLYSRLFLASP
ncbi:Very-short-patch mismatch repair endonuclease (G-T specific) [Klebsiella pneumoniae ISC21]|nr:Very-short-patch mismatch repair endonuclease (G-T specific) [Klebsiella pneumoniae ISC21]